MGVPLFCHRASEIAEYIARDNPTAAENWVNAIFTHVEQLKKFPGSGRNMPEINNYSFRELIYGNYRIVYRIEENRVSILTIRHGKQILPTDEILT